MESRCGRADVEVERYRVLEVSSRRVGVKVWDSRSLESCRGPEDARA